MEDLKDRLKPYTIEPSDDDTGFRGRLAVARTVEREKPVPAFAWIDEEGNLHDL